MPFNSCQTLHADASLLHKRLDDGGVDVPLCREQDGYHTLRRNTLHRMNDKEAITSVLHALSQSWPDTCHGDPPCGIDRPPSPAQSSSQADRGSVIISSVAMCGTGKHLDDAGASVCEVDQLLKCMHIHVLDSHHSLLHKFGSDIRRFAGRDYLARLLVRIGFQSLCCVERRSASLGCVYQAPELTARASNCRASNAN